MPLMVIEFIFNTAILPIKVVVALCSKNVRKNLKKSVINTLYGAPRRRLITVVDIVNYPKYLHLLAVNS